MAWLLLLFSTEVVPTGTTNDLLIISPSFFSQSSSHTASVWHLPTLAISVLKCPLLLDWIASDLCDYSFSGPFPWVFFLPLLPTCTHSTRNCPWPFSPSIFSHWTKLSTCLSLTAISMLVASEHTPSELKVPRLLTEGCASSDMPY